jgi:hypothetical protein
MLLSVGTANETVLSAKMSQHRASGKIDSDLYRFQLSNKHRYAGRMGEKERIQQGRQAEQTNKSNEIP